MPKKRLEKFTNFKCTHHVLRAGSVVFGKTMSGFRKTETVVGVPNVKNGWNRAIRNWIVFLEENVHHISIDSFCPKISVWSRLTFYALAVLSSLTFFRVGGDAESVYKTYSIATSQINLW